MLRMCCHLHPVYTEMLYSVHIHFFLKHITSFGGPSSSMLLYQIPSVLHSFPHREELFLWFDNQIENLLYTKFRSWGEKLRLCS